MTFAINNEGIGGNSLLTLGVDATANKDFSHADLAANLTACVISANNEAGMGVFGAKLFGKVISISEEQQAGTTLPSRCTVQARGVARFKYSGVTPIINAMIAVVGNGSVRDAPPDVDIAAGGHLARGMVINVIIATTEVDVWLG